MRLLLCFVSILVFAACSSSENATTHAVQPIQWPTHRSGIWKSDNNGNGFCPINNGLPASDNWNGYLSAIKKSTDEGKKINIVLELKDSLTLQAIKEDPFTPGKFFAR